MVTPAITAPPLLFILAHVEDDADGTAVVELIAATTDDAARAGTSMTAAQIDGERIEVGEEVGVIVWDTTTGVCEHIYVEPPWRRRGIATALLRHAGKIARQSNLPAITVASVRTALGEVWVQGTGAAAAPLDAFSWPLTPPEDIEGITDRRLLIPDDPEALRPAAEMMAPGSAAGRAVGKTIDTACGPANGVPLHRWRR